MVSTCAHDGQRNSDAQTAQVFTTSCLPLALVLFGDDAFSEDGLFLTGPIKDFCDAILMQTWHRYRKGLTCEEKVIGVAHALPAMILFFLFLFVPLSVLRFLFFAPQPPLLLPLDTRRTPSLSSLDSLHSRDTLLSLSLYSSPSPDTPEHRTP